MFPPPISRPTRAPSPYCSWPYSANLAFTAASIPYSLSPSNDSPLSFRTIRLYASFAIIASSLRLVPQVIPCKASDRDVFPHPPDRLVDQVPNRLSRITDERLLEEN